MLDTNQIVERKSEITELQCVIKGNQNSKHKCVIVGQLWYIKLYNIYWEFLVRDGDSEIQLDSICETLIEIFF